jgi:hypothetical protein
MEVAGYVLGQELGPLSTDIKLIKQQYAVCTGPNLSSVMNV